jgi:hypothetical protein
MTHSNHANPLGGERCLMDWRVPPFLKRLGDCTKEDLEFSVEFLNALAKAKEASGGSSGPADDDDDEGVDFIEGGGPTPDSDVIQMTPDDEERIRGAA